MTALRAPDPDLLAALDALVQALEEFRAAYEAWSAAPADDLDRLRAALAQAERRVDAAREALAAVEERLPRG